MNMISPLAGTSLWHADIETGKVISEWKFQKDGVDVAMKDIATENKAAQVRGCVDMCGCACVCVCVCVCGPPAAASARVELPTVRRAEPLAWRRFEGTRACCAAPLSHAAMPVAADQHHSLPAGLPPPCPQTEDTNVFLGLDTNRLARWDMRDPHGIVSQAASPIVAYAGGKDYSRGTKFRWGGQRGWRP